MRNVVLVVAAFCAACASEPSSDSIKVQSNGKPWTATPFHGPRGEDAVIIVPVRDWPMFIEGKAGTATPAEGRKAAEDYVTQRQLPCSVGQLSNELVQGGWIVKLTCTTAASRKE